MVFSLKFWLFGLFAFNLYSSYEVCGSPVHNFRDAQIDQEDVPVNDVNYEDMIEFGRSNDAQEKRFVYTKRDSQGHKDGILEKRIYYGKTGRSMVPKESAFDKRFAYENGRQLIPHDAQEKRLVYEKRDSKGHKDGIQEKRMYYGKTGRSMVPKESAFDKRFAYENGRQFIPHDAKENRFVNSKRESKAHKEGTLQKRIYYGKTGRSVIPKESAFDKRFAYENGLQFIPHDVQEKRFVYGKRESKAPKDGILEKRMYYGKTGRSVIPKESAFDKRFAYENGLQFIPHDVQEKRFVYGKRESKAPKDGILEKRMYYGKTGRSVIPKESAFDKRFAYENGLQFIPHDVQEKRFVYVKRESKAPKDGILEKRMYYGKTGRSMVPKDSAFDKRFTFKNERRSTLKSSEDGFAKTDEDFSR